MKTSSHALTFVRLLALGAAGCASSRTQTNTVTQQTTTSEVDAQVNTEPPQPDAASLVTAATEAGTTNNATGSVCNFRAATVAECGAGVPINRACAVAGERCSGGNGGCSGPPGPTQRCSSAQWDCVCRTGVAGCSNLTWDCRQELHPAGPQPPPELPA